MSVLVIGVGTPHGDDAAGLLVARALREARPEGVDVSLCESPADLAGLLRPDRAVVLVDATRSGRRPGTVHRVAPEALCVEARGCSSHGFGVAEALALARALGRLPQRLYVVGIEGAEGEGEPSPALRDALPAALRRVLALCRELGAAA